MTSSTGRRVNSYLDTSALVKLVLAERATEMVERLWAQVDDPYASLLGYAELRSAVAMAIRSGRVDATGAPAAAGTPRRSGAG